MSDSLLELQQQFSFDVVGLIRQAITIGYGVTLGEAWRSSIEDEYDASHGLGIRRSLHSDRLAIDLNLFKPDGTYITDDTGHRDLGAWWKAQDSRHRWGGDFPKADFNHYSLSPDGIRG